MIKIKNTLKIFFIISSAINIYGIENNKKDELIKQSPISYKTIKGLLVTGTVGLLGWCSTMGNKLETLNLFSGVCAVGGLFGYVYGRRKNKDSWKRVFLLDTGERLDELDKIKTRIDEIEAKE